MLNPYSDKQPDEWLTITKKLVDDFPIDKKKLVEVVLDSWSDIFLSKIGGVIKIGDDIKITPQMAGNFLHILIAHKLAEKYPKKWRKELLKSEKDIVYIPNNDYSFEIKTSSSKSDIYGNRSYAQPQSSNGQKSKNGFYLGINFNLKNSQEITSVRLGWLNHSDWIAQKSPTGQQARLTREAKAFKFIELLNI
jgi:hypothetical protein